jgi:1,4-alpha-glucan branching enzyme
MVDVKGKKIQFRFFRPQAAAVQLVGDFNGWGRQELPMSRSADGYWTATLHLSGGTYRFRYRADGEWFTDYAAFGVECEPSGINSILRVAEETRMEPSCGRFGRLDAKQTWTPRTQPPGPNRRGGRSAAASGYESSYEKSVA